MLSIKIILLYINNCQHVISINNSIIIKRNLKNLENNFKIDFRNYIYKKNHDYYNIFSDFLKIMK